MTDLAPKINSVEDYRAWVSKWKRNYKKISQNIRSEKLKYKELQRTNTNPDSTSLNLSRAMGRKMMMLLDEAKLQLSNRFTIENEITEHFQTFPLTIDNARNIEFHFNKKHLQYPDVVPMWILKAKGSTYYLNHIDCSTPWTTRERPEHQSTKGSIRIKKGTIEIDKNGNAVIK
ncbi:hypothetical protein FDI40_gp254 [Agrobacterium phage Atu_ph07]|uniref:WW domain-containing protein n=1 Tax=Agrobacterium phage Atu_ph07 TaxID=2024264 RepID=A0A2L0UZS4_9CAUD|nr:hypothetical protein FDI40_gp254 [Agrobacterium phage Atu_ph07]AUZ95033.1 hypothetical protein [Agrobacterium phage Atu_ph07]